MSTKNTISQWARSVLYIGAIAGFVACAPPPFKHPDLVPTSASPGGFCELTGNPQKQLFVVVHVTNVGQAHAPASVTRVTFSNSSKTDIQTPALDPTASITLPSVAESCAGVTGDCSATIEVNVTNTVAEPDSPSRRLQCLVRLR